MNYKIAACWQATILAALVFPVTPLWGLVPYLFAGLILFKHKKDFWDNAAYCCLPIMLALGWLHAQSIIHDPLEYMRSMVHIDGLALPLTMSSILCFHQIVLMFLLMRLAFSITTLSAYSRLFLIGMPCLALLFQLTPVVHATQWLATSTQAMPANIASEFSALVLWNGWVLAGLVTFILAQTSPHLVRGLLYTVICAGGIIAGLIVFQHAIGDYSYVVAGESVLDHLERVRATYYYHAPATWLVALSLVIVSAYSNVRSKKWWGIFVLLIVAVLLNNTRAIMLAIAVSGCALIVLHNVTRNRFGAMIAVLLVAFSMSHVFYVKTRAEADSSAMYFEKYGYHPNQKLPTSEGKLPTPESKLPTSEGKLATSEGFTIRNARLYLQDYIESNLFRLGIMGHGINTALSQPFLGQGAGNISIPLDEKYSKYGPSTDSSHSLAVDIAIACGMLTALIFMIMFLGTLFKGVHLLGKHSRLYSFSHNNALITLVAIMLFFLISSAFFPQERNFFVALFFILWGLSIHQMTIAPTPDSENGLVPKGLLNRYAIGGLIAASVMYSLMWSASITWPLAELAMLRGQAAKPETPIYTNSKLIHFSSKYILAFITKNPMGNISLLDDKITSLPKKNAWLMWDRSRDSVYPNIFHGLGYNFVHAGGVSPYFVMPSNWQLLNKLQPSVALIYIE